MRRLFAAAALFLLSTTGVGWADTDADAPRHHSIGLGFHNSTAPGFDVSPFGDPIPSAGPVLGLRWWFPGQKVGLDLGLGFASINAGEPTPDEDERLRGWSIEAGVPFVFSSWPRVHAILRPGIVYQSQEFTTATSPAPFDTENATTFAVTGEVEAEVFLADNVSFSASHGIAFASFDPGLPGSDSQTAFSTLGNNFTEVGFHLYLWGRGY